MLLLVDIQRFQFLGQRFVGFSRSNEAITDMRLPLKSAAMVAPLMFASGHLLGRSAGNQPDPLAKKAGESTRQLVAQAIYKCLHGLLRSRNQNPANI
jgi:hypothetical protein